MCFPCWKYQDVYFEKRPKGPKTNQYPQPGAAYATAGYCTPAPMMAAPAQPIPLVTMPPPIVQTRPVVPTLYPVAPTTVASPVSNRDLSLRPDFAPESHFALPITSLPHAASRRVAAVSQGAIVLDSLFPPT